MLVNGNSWHPHSKAKLSGDLDTKIVRLENDDGIVFLTSKCAAAFKPEYAKFRFYPGLRSMINVGEDTALIWREDSVSPVVIPFPRNSRTDLMLSREAIYFAHKPVLSETDNTAILVGYGSKNFLLLVVGEAVTALKVSLKLNVPASAVELEQEEPPMGVFGTLADKDFAGAYQWEHSSLVRLPGSSDSAICSFRVPRFFENVDMLRRDYQSGAITYGTYGTWALANHRETLKFMFSARSLPGPLYGNQVTLAKVIRLYRDLKFLEAWMSVPGEWWDRAWVDELLMDIVKDQPLE